ncbi:MAG TPA: hypothetical protein VLI04_03515 [Nocardioidaceae bacterium]|nr:hypothetical protein [Nocardioidaceae bacterium]
MELTQFHTLRTAVQGNALLPTNTALASMEEDLRELLMSSGLFEEVEVERTDNPDALIIALCQFKPEMSEREVAGTLEQIWQDRVRYPFWEAHTTLVAPEHVEFEGATRFSSAGHFATVHLVAQKARIPAQRGPS